MMNEKQKRFVEEYFVDSNMQRAYMQAYNTANMKSAREAGCKLLKNPEVILELEKLQKERMERINWSADEILKEIKEIAHSENSSKAEKLKALELAAKSMGMFREKVEHSGGLQIILGQNIEEWAQ